MSRYYSNQTNSQQRSLNGNINKTIICNAQDLVVTDSRYANMEASISVNQGRGRWRPVWLLAVSITGEEILIDEKIRRGILFCFILYE